LIKQNNIYKKVVECLISKDFYSYLAVMLIVTSQVKFQLNKSERIIDVFVLFSLFILNFLLTNNVKTPILALVIIEC